MSKTLIRNKEKVGFLPWNRSRLGCIRWTSLTNFDTDNRPTVVFDPPIARIEFENLEVSPGYTTHLPRYTQSGRFSNPQPISWNLDENNTTSEIDGWKLTVGGPVDEEVVLIATLDEIEIQRFSVFVVMPPPKDLEVNHVIPMSRKVHRGDSTRKITFFANRGLQYRDISKIIKCQYKINNLPWKDVKEGHYKRAGSTNLICDFEVQPSEIDTKSSFTVIVQFIADDNNTFQLTEKFEIIEEKVAKSEPIRAATKSDKTKEKIELVEEQTAESEPIRAADTSDKTKEKIELVEEQTAESEPIKTKFVSERYKGKTGQSKLKKIAENTNILMAAGSSDNCKNFMQEYVEISQKDWNKNLLKEFISKILECEPDDVTFSVERELEKALARDDYSNNTVDVRCKKRGCTHKREIPFKKFLEEGRWSCPNGNHSNKVKKNSSSKKNNSNPSKKKNKSPTNNSWRYRWPRSDR